MTSASDRVEAYSRQMISPVYISEIHKKLGNSSKLDDFARKIMVVDNHDNGADYIRIEPSVCLPFQY